MGGRFVCCTHYVREIGGKIDYQLNSSKRLLDFSSHPNFFSRMKSEKKMEFKKVE